MQELTAFAEALADEAGAIIRRYFRQNPETERKDNATPVTVADRAVEARLRELIGARYPRDGILGEEFGVTEGSSGRTWVLDPIDGTKSFIVGRPSFGTLIALCEDDIPVLGIIDQPVIAERWTGAAGRPTVFNGSPVRTRAATALSGIRVGATDPAQLSMETAAALRGAVDFMVWGGDCYMYGLLASGGLDAVIESGMSPYDYAALVPVVQGAGGVMSDWEGKPLTLRSGDRTLAAGSAEIHRQLLAFL